MTTTAFCLVMLSFVTLAYTQDHGCYDQPETGKCKAYLPSYFYNSTLGICDCYVYGGCGAGANHFSSLYSCQWTCAVDPLDQYTTDNCHEVFDGYGGPLEEAHTDLGYELFNDKNEMDNNILDNFFYAP